MADLPDFDEMLRLARRDPERLERLRREASDALIESAPPEQQRRLRGLQFEIDAHRRRAGDPARAMLQLHDLMVERFLHLRELLNSASGTARWANTPAVPTRRSEPRTAGSARIIPLRPRQRPL